MHAVKRGWVRLDMLEMCAVEYFGLNHLLCVVVAEWSL